MLRFAASNPCSLKFSNRSISPLPLACSPLLMDLRLFASGRKESNFAWYSLQPKPLNQIKNCILKPCSGRAFLATWNGCTKLYEALQLTQCNCLLGMLCWLLHFSCILRLLICNLGFSFKDTCSNLKTEHSILMLGASIGSVSYIPFLNFKNNCGWLRGNSCKLAWSCKSMISQECGIYPKDSKCKDNIFLLHKEGIKIQQ